MYVVRVILVLATALPLACLEMPITRLSKTDDPIVSPDASTDGGLGAQQPCFDCLNAPEVPGPGCVTAYSACRDDNLCGKILDCGFARGCFQGSQGAFFMCGNECLRELGVILPDEPVLVLASNLFQCLANGACGMSCFSSR